MSIRDFPKKKKKVLKIFFSTKGGPGIKSLGTTALNHFNICSLLSLNFKQLFSMSNELSLIAGYLLIMYKSTHGVSFY